MLTCIKLGRVYHAFKDIVKCKPTRLYVLRGDLHFTRAGADSYSLYIEPYDYYCYYYNHFLYIDYYNHPLYTRMGAYKNPE